MRYPMPITTRRQNSNLPALPIPFYSNTSAVVTSRVFTHQCGSMCLWDGRGPSAPPAAGDGAGAAGAGGPPRHPWRPPRCADPRPPSLAHGVARLPYGIHSTTAAHSPDCTMICRFSGSMKSAEHLRVVRDARPGFFFLRVGDGQILPTPQMCVCMCTCLWSCLCFCLCLCVCVYTRARVCASLCLCLRACARLRACVRRSVAGQPV